MNSGLRAETLRRRKLLKGHATDEAQADPGWWEQDDEREKFRRAVPVIARGVTCLLILAIVSNFILMLLILLRLPASPSLRLRVSA